MDTDMGKLRVILMFAGFVILIVCLSDFLFSRSPGELFVSSLGMMAIIYGFYRKDKKVNVTINYFFTMLCVLIFQWLILGFIAFYPNNSVNDISTAFTLTFFITMFFYMQIRESHQLKINWKGIYFGERKIF